MPKQALEVLMRVESPLLLGRRRPTSLLAETLRYVPGAVLRGAVAEVLLAECAAREHIFDHAHCPVREACDFYQLFGGPKQIVFENAYPVSDEFSVSLPLPATARSCKKHPGFLEAGKSRPHGIRDVLIRQYAWEEAWLPADRAPRTQPSAPPYLEDFLCPACGSEQDVLSESFRFYSRLAEGPYQTVKVPVQRMSRVAINRRTATAEEGLLYTLEAISEKQVFFKGMVIVEDIQKTLLLSTLERVTALGSGRSRGLGQVKVTAKEATEKFSPDLAERLARFNNLMAEERAFHRRVKAALGTQEANLDNRPLWFFTVDLVSDALLPHDGLPMARLEADMVAEALGVDSEAISLARAWARQHVVSGRLAAGLPRATQLAVQMGSVFLYRVQDFSQADLLPRLQLLEAQGIGRERERGYGRILVCAPFHLEVKEV